MLPPTSVAADYEDYLRGLIGLRHRHRSKESGLMSDVETLFVSWLVGLALSSWLFLQIVEGRARVEQLVVSRRVHARPISPKHGALSDARTH
jgi:hypothetical protein